MIQNQSGKPDFKSPDEKLRLNMKYASKLIKATFVPKVTAQAIVQREDGNDLMGKVDESVEMYRVQFI
jgi:hypothetical protein